MSSNTTSISGQGPAAICKRYGAYLCSRIYEEPSPPAESPSRFPDEIKKEETGKNGGILTIKVLPYIPVF